MNGVGLTILLAIVLLAVVAVLVWRDEKGKAAILSTEAKAENKVGDWFKKMLAKFQ